MMKLRQNIEDPFCAQSIHSTWEVKQIPVVSKSKWDEHQIWFKVGVIYSSGKWHFNLTFSFQSIQNCLYSIHFLLILPSLNLVSSQLKLQWWCCTEISTDLSAFLSSLCWFLLPFFLLSQCWFLLPFFLFCVGFWMTATVVAINVFRLLTKCYTKCVWTVLSHPWNKFRLSETG